MHPRLLVLAPILLAAGLSLAAEAPLVSFDFEEGLKNTGTLGGAGTFKVYAAGEDAGFDLGPFGRCIDFTAASRHGGTGTAEPPAGGAVVFRQAALDPLDTFTILLWSRQSPLAQGPNARLLMKDNSWDVMPAGGGVSLGLGPRAGNTSYILSAKTRSKVDDAWRFRAVVVAPDTVRAYAGGLQESLALCAEKPRAEHRAAARGDLVLGNLGSIRPFNGWMDRVRIYSGALDEAAVRKIFEADVAAAKPAILPSVFDLARPAAQTHRFQLPLSAIPFSTRWQKKEALAILESFHTSQCLWVYGSGKEFIQQVKGMGIGYQGTLNGLQGQEQATVERSAAGDPSGRHEDLDGNKNTPHWMLAFGPKTFTGCCNHPAFRKLFFEAAKRHLDAGVDMIHVDDWAMNASWVLTGAACFCDSCRSGFREWLQQRCTPEELRKLGIEDIASFDYREHLNRHGVPDAATYREKFRDLPLTPQFTQFQVESMRRFFRELRHKLDEWSPQKYIPVSANALLTHLNPNSNLCGVDVIDFFTGESPQNADYQTETEFVFAAKAAEAFGMTQVVSPIPQTTARTRAALATTYALGQLHLVPWDLYMGSDATGIQPRYFGTREQYGDLSDFIHEHKALFDGFGPVSELGVLANADAPGGLQEFCKKLAARQVPFHLILGASQSARVPVRSADLRAVRVLVEFSPTATFCPEDQKTIQSARDSGQVRFVSPSADLATVSKLRGMELLRLEAPENIYAFPRVDSKKRSAAIHVVNWNLGPNPERAELYRNVTLTLLQPERWGAIASAVWLQPGQEPVDLKPEKHADCVRLNLPQLETWGIVEVRCR